MVATPLIERISKLDAPDREVDAEIDRYFGLLVGIGAFSGPRTLYPDQELYKKTELYTASVDAAIALAERVLPGWGFFLRRDKDGHNCGMVYPVHNFVTPGTESGATPAISMCIAILRATESGQP